VGNLANNLTEFFFLSEPNVRTVLIGLFALSFCLSLAGSVAFVQKKSLIGDMAAHAVLPGICLAFLLAGEKRTDFMLGGAFLSSGLSVFLMQKITTKSKIKEDTALAVILAFFFGAGVWLLSYVKNSGNAGQAGLETYLLGSAASIAKSDMYAALAISAFFAVFFLLGFRSIQVFCFDKEYARTSGMNTALWAWILNSLTIVAVCLGVQAIGVVLISSMLISPAAAAYFRTKRFSKLLIIAVLFGFVEVYLGAMISYLFSGIPTGPVIVAAGFLGVVLSFVLGRKRR
jgi:manganese/zinc/iron transport system permease protein